MRLTADRIQAAADLVDTDPALFDRFDHARNFREHGEICTHVRCLAKSGFARLATLDRHADIQ